MKKLLIYSSALYLLFTSCKKADKENLEPQLFDAKDKKAVIATTYPVYEYYRPSNGDHLYVPDYDPQGFANYGYQFYGEAFKGIGPGDTQSRFPLARMVKNGYHWFGYGGVDHYNKQLQGWKDEPSGTLIYVYSTGSVPVYQFHCTYNNGYYYSKNGTPFSQYWVQDGIAWYTLN